jgi:arginine decarboxylase
VGDQHLMPLVQAINDYKQKDTARFHVPGHKGRDESLGGFLTPLYPFDVTEIPGLDDLHHPEEAILAAQGLAAELFAAEETFFLVGGSTAGNLAMILAACRPGEEILVQRNVHKSVIHGLILAGVKPIYLAPVIEPNTSLPVVVPLQEVKASMRKHPQVKAVLLSNPNYYGMGMDLRPYARLCREEGIPLLVDEAHGAHFGFAEGLPTSAMQAGAAAAVQSTHKMLPSLTMSSMLHVQGELLDRGRLRQALTMVQSSSPSYLLMASLDSARSYMAYQGKKDLTQVLALARNFRQQVDHLRIPWLTAVQKSSVYDFLDPLKITLRTDAPDFHGFALKEFLEGQGIYPEMADQHHVLLVLSPLTKKEDLDRVLASLSGLDRSLEIRMDQVGAIPSQLLIKEQVYSPGEVFNRESETIPFDESAGRVYAEMIIPYPPGVPIICHGERMDQETIDYICQLQAIGCHFQGSHDSTLKTVKVVRG